MLAKVYLRADFKLRAQIRQECLKERRNFYSGQNWPFYEGSHDKLLDTLLQESKNLEMAAVTSVGLSRKQWNDSVSTHFSYPNNDKPFRALYKEVLEEYRKPIIEEHTKSLSEEMMGPAWRWLMLRNSEVEDKMV